MERGLGAEPCCPQTADAVANAEVHRGGRTHEYSALYFRLLAPGLGASSRAQAEQHGGFVKS